MTCSEKPGQDHMAGGTDSPPFLLLPTYKSQALSFIE